MYRTCQGQLIESACLTFVHTFARYMSYAIKLVNKGIYKLFTSVVFSFLFKIKQFISVNSLKLASIVDKIKDKNKSFLFVNIN